MHYKQILKYLILIIIFGIINSQEKLSSDELLSKFNHERKIGNYENAEKLAVQLNSTYELDSELSKETFANHLEYFAKFYLQIEKDSISNILFFRSAKIYENEIIRIQKRLYTPVKELDKIFISNSETFFQSPYSQLLNELSDSNRSNLSDSSSFSP